MNLGQMKCPNCGQYRPTIPLPCMCGYNPETGKVEKFKDLFNINEVKTYSNVEESEIPFISTWQKCDELQPEESELKDLSKILLDDEPLMLSHTFLITYINPYTDTVVFIIANRLYDKEQRKWYWYDVNHDKIVTTHVEKWMVIPPFE